MLHAIFADSPGGFDMHDHDFDTVIIGAGVVGLATAYYLSQQQSVLLIEQHPHMGEETSSRNSEVIHAGIYYPHASLKQRWCLRGKQLLYEFCRRYKVPFHALGKLIVAQPDQMDQLQALYNHGTATGVELQELNQQQLQQLEPCVSAQAALLSPTTGIVDSHTFMQRLEALALQQQAHIQYRCRLIEANAQQQGWTLRLQSGEQSFTLRSRVLINCAGLHAQKVAQRCQLSSERIPTLYPCRGQYFRYHGHSPVSHLVYPLPDANLTGLGIHATVDLSGQLKFGPDVNYQSDLDDYRVDLTAKQQFVSAIKRYLPTLDWSRLQPDYSGIRPKLSDATMPGKDFQVEFSRTDCPAFVHLFGIESPGLTASLAIAESITDWLQGSNEQALLAN
ncbi:NAD(P)/FAD-dependent oxidoreductase [Bacterioplanes sanyensis]|nr:NAD(P)/FAD-dependent oxidoreductase [Bacterioplanes sanyensis]